jgi:hypothetical protein
MVVVEFRVVSDQEILPPQELTPVGVEALV